MKLQHLKTLRTIVKYRKMKENMKSVEVSMINSKIAKNQTKQQHISNLFDKNHTIYATDSGSIIATMNYYQRQSKELQESKQLHRSLTVEAKKISSDFHDLYVERKVAENIFEHRKEQQKQSEHAKSIRIHDEIGSMVGNKQRDCHS